MIASGSGWLGGIAIFTALAGCGDGNERAPRHRLLVVGWDGASNRMVDPLLEQGRLPHVKELRERGARAPGLQSTIVPISSAAWVAATTGKGPGETGVYGFFEPVPESYDVRLVSSRSNRAAPIWRILTSRGLTSIVFGVPLTYPPEPILGAMVSGMLAPKDSSYAWPSELAAELRSRHYQPDLEPWLEPRAVAWRDVEAHLAEQRAILLELLGQQDWDFAFVVFKSLDVVSHLSYERDFAAQVTPLYERLDALLGDLVDAAGEDTNVLLVSDHGFHVYRAGFNLHAWLLERGWSVRKEKVKRFTIDEGDPLERRERELVRQLRNELDWSKTRAFSFVTEGNCGAIRLNLQGREPEGCVAPEEADALLASLAGDLESATDAKGAKLVQRVWRTSELYPGPHRDALPDLVFAIDPEQQVFSDPEEANVFGEYEKPVPDHDLWGIFIAAGPSIASRGTPSTPQGGGEPPEILDLAPTSLHLLDQPIPSDMQGRVLTEFLRELPEPRFVEPGAKTQLRAPPAAPYTPEQLTELEAELRRLGYL